MSRYRIIEDNGLFFPQRRKLFGYEYFSNANTEGMISVRYDNKIGVSSKEKAMLLILREVEAHTVTIHEVQDLSKCPPQIRG